MKDGKGASSCDSVDGSGKRAGTGKSRNLVEKIFKQSLIIGQGVWRFERFEFLSEKINFTALGDLKSSSFEPDTSHP